MRKHLSKLSSRLHYFVGTVSPALQPVLLGWVRIFDNFYHWLYTTSPNRGRMICNAMSRKID